jgi:cell division protein FtsL
MRRSQSNRRKKLWLLGLLSFLALILFLSMGKRGFIQQIRVYREKKRLEKEIEALNEQRERLQGEKEKLNDPETIEKIAREEYGMAKEKEKVYRVVPKEEK